MTIELIAELKGHSGPIYKLIQADNLLFSASSDKMIGTWDLLTNSSNSLSIKAEAGVFTLDYNGENLFLGTSNGHVNIINIKERRELRNLKLHNYGVYSILNIKSRNMLVTGGADGFVHFHDGTDYSIIRSIKLSNKKIRSVIKTPEGDSVLIGCGEGVVREIELDYFNETRTIKTAYGGVNSICCHQDKPVFLTGSKEGVIQVWKRIDGSELLNIQAHESNIYDLQFNASGKLMATVSRDKSVKIWNADSLEPLFRIDSGRKGHRYSVNSLCWISDNEFLTAGDDRTIKRWIIRK